ncbi:MAG: TetR family transcriptional regulator [Candidatus Lokiarchaeota archaeon]|nr:TetR family transcriptional regulator [Candidatus Lokiarchaeota archaeon]
MKNLTRREREKLVRKNLMIKAAKKLFSNYNFNDVTMDEIANEAEFTKRTLYQYFSSKEDIYFAVILGGFKKLYSYFQKSIKVKATGYRKLLLAISAYYTFYKQNPKIFKLMNYVGYVKRNRESSLSYKDFQKFDDLLFRELARIIEEGQIDGSIRSDLNPQTTGYALAFLITGFFQQLSESGKSFTKFHSMDEDEFIDFIIDLLLASLSKK